MFADSETPKGRRARPHVLPAASSEFENGEVEIGDGGRLPAKGGQEGQVRVSTYLARCGPGGAVRGLELWMP